MSTTMSTSFHPETDIIKEFPLHKKWKKAIVEKFKEQAKDIEEPEEISDLLQDWSWFKDPHPWIFTTLNILARNPACSAYLMASHYIFDQGREFGEVKRKEVQQIAQKFRRALAYLHMVGLVHGEVLFPTEHTALRNAVTIWITPFAKEKDIQNVKNYYLSIGGKPKKPAKADSKTPEEISEHNRKVKVHTIMDHYRENPQLFDYFKCPKKHPEGFKTPRKPQSHWKKKQYIRKCQDCGRELIQITHKEFMQLKYRALCEQWEVKP